MSIHDYVDFPEELLRGEPLHCTVCGEKMKLVDKEFQCSQPSHYSIRMEHLDALMTGEHQCPFCERYGRSSLDVYCAFCGKRLGDIL